MSWYLTGWRPQLFWVTPLQWDEREKHQEPQLYWLLLYLSHCLITLICTSSITLISSIHLIPPSNAACTAGVNKPCRNQWIFKYTDAPSNEWKCFVTIALVHFAQHLLDLMDFDQIPFLSTVIYSYYSLYREKTSSYNSISYKHINNLFM